MEEKEKMLKTGTTTMGIVCKDCIILAADKRVTADYMVVSKDIKKIVKINDKFALTMAGTVSEAQLLIKVIRAQIALKENQTNRDITSKEAANMLAGMLYQAIRTPSMIQGIAHFLLAGINNDLSLYDLYPDGSISKIEDYVSSGSGSVYTIGVLESAYKKDMTQKEGIELAKKAISTSLKRDTMSGNGFDIMVVNKEGATFVESGDINTGIY